jgi:HEAT repeat protein
MTKAMGPIQSRATCRAHAFLMGLALALAGGPAAAQAKGAAAPSKSAAAPAKGAVAPAKSAVAPAKGDASPAKGPRASKLDAAAVTAQLASPDTMAAGLAAAQAAGAGAKAVAPRIEELLVKGLPPSLAIAAIGALGAIGEASSSAAIAPYVKHRDAEVRRAAAQALARTRGPAAAAALLRGLRSNDAELRSLSATGLRAAGDKDSVPDLVKALDRGIAEAAPSIGALCEGACKELLARLDKVRPDVRRATLEAMLVRKPALPDDALVAAVEKIRSDPDPSARAYFQGLKKVFKGSKTVRKALEAAAQPAKEGAK